MADGEKKINHVSDIQGKDAFYNGLALGMDEDDTRHAEWREQRDKMIGIDDTVMYSLDISLAKMIGTHLRYFSEDISAYPDGMVLLEWELIVSEMVEGFELYANYDEWNLNDDHNDNMFKVTLALTHFQKHFFHLWQ